MAVGLNRRFPIDPQAGYRQLQGVPITRTSFKKGQSGNPKGKPKALVDVQAYARQRTRANIDILAKWSSQEQDPVTAVRATIALHEIAWGRPSQAVQHSGPDNGPIICKWQE